MKSHFHVVAILTFSMTTLAAGGEPAALPSGYIQEMVFLGPIDASAVGGRAQRLAWDPVPGGEAALMPSEGAALTVDGSNFTWFRASAVDDYFHTKEPPFPAQPDADYIMYAAIYVRSPEARDCRLSLGCDDAQRTYINGMKAYENPANRSMSFDDDQFDIHLVAGPNLILIKHELGHGDLGLCARLMSNGQNVPDAWGLTYEFQDTRELTDVEFDPPAVSLRTTQDPVTTVLRLAEPRAEETSVDLNTTGSPVAKTSPNPLIIQAGQTEGTITVEPLGALLRTGDNVVAVEVHQTSGTSSDISFDMELRGALGGVLISPGAVWKYHDKGQDLGSAWREVGYDDSGWDAGPGQLGYGDGDEATVLSYGDDSSNKYPCYYFRKTISIPDPSNVGALELRMVRDDSAAVYINGAEIVRSNLPDGKITYSTWSADLTDNEDAWRTFNPDSSITGTCRLHAGHPLLVGPPLDVEVTNPSLSFYADGTINQLSISASSPQGEEVHVAIPDPVDVAVNVTVSTPNPEAITVENGALTIEPGETLSTQPCIVHAVMDTAGLGQVSASATHSRFAFDAAALAVEITEGLVSFEPRHVRLPIATQGPQQVTLDIAAAGSPPAEPVTFNVSKTGTAADSILVTEPVTVQAGETTQTVTFSLAPGAAPGSAEVSFQHADYGIGGFNVVLYDADLPPVVINEIMASNGSVIADEEGNYEDWFELYNMGDRTVDLSGFLATDEIDQPDKWQFPSGITIAPDGHLLVWASGIDGFGEEQTLETFSVDPTLLNDGENVVAVEVHQFSRSSPDLSFDLAVTATPGGTLLALGSTWRYYDAGNTPQNSGQTDWNDPGYADDGWNIGPAELGYGEGDEATTVTYGEDPEEKHIAAYFRNSFQVTEAAAVTGLDLSLLYDDGAIVYVNGAEVARYNMPDGQVSYTTLATSASTEELHTNFRLERDGEALSLLTPDNIPIDTVVLDPQARDISYGRSTDAASEWVFFNVPTPGATNDSPPSQGIVTAPIASVQGGLYDGPVSVQLVTATPGAVIRYTTDGSTPDGTSTPYETEITFDETGVLRARAFLPGYVPSSTTSHSYLIGATRGLGITSLVTDPEHFFGPDGIYDNPFGRGDEWERPCHVEFFDETGNVEFVAPHGIRIHGRGSRHDPKLNFRFYFSRGYGLSPLRDDLFPHRNYDEFYRLLLRAGGDDSVSNTSHWTLIRDPLSNQLFFDLHDMGSDTRWTRLYLNGRPWGVYAWREYVDNFYADVFCGSADVDMIKPEDGGYTVEEGDIFAWNDMIAWFNSHDLTTLANYAEAQQLIDVESLTEEYLLRVYSAISGSPDRIFVRKRQPGALWRLILWDVDRTFTPSQVNDNRLNDAINSSSWSCIPFRELIRNREYKEYFISRFADALNSTFLPENVIAAIDEHESILGAFISENTDRWGSDPTDWAENIEELREFARRRPEVVRSHLLAELGDVITSTEQLTIGPPQGGTGTVYVNSNIELRPEDCPWQGTYFAGVPVSLRAEPDPGNVFVGWSNPDIPQTAETAINFGGLQQRLVDYDATWNYNDTGTDLGTSWREQSFDDTSWSAGPGPFGYGESNLGTDLDFGGDSANKHPCYYLRHSFDVSNVADFGQVRLSIMRDDGAVVYVNGNEVLRTNMPGGDITYSTLAENNMAGSDETAWHTKDLDASMLVDGTNNIAVEVHQVDPTSADIRFQLTLEVVRNAGIITAGSDWLYDDSGTDLGTAWIDPAYDDSLWPQGPAQLGYGDDGEATVLSYGGDPDNRYTTYYFRKTFQVGDPANMSFLDLGVKRDDGAIVYINGEEVYRTNMPDGPVAFDTLASDNVGGSDESSWYHTSLPTSVLTPGENVIAVEVHQDDVNSSDITFDLKLSEGGGTIIYPIFEPGETVGQPVWVANGGDQIKTAPAIAPDGTVYFGSDDGGLRAVDNEGNLKWAVPTGGPVRSDPAIGDDGTVYFGSDDGLLRAVQQAVDDPQSFDLLWAFNAGDVIRSSPAIAPDRTILFGADNGTFYALQPDPPDPNSITPLWTFQAGTAGQNIRSGAAIAGDGTILFGCNDNSVYAIRPNAAVPGTASVVWKFETGGDVSGTPAIARDNTVYATSKDGILYALGPAGIEKWRLDVVGSIRSTPVIGPDGTVYFGSYDEWLYAVDPDASTPDDRVKWAYETGDNIEATPAVGSNGTVYVPSHDGSLYAFAANPPDPADVQPLWRFDFDGADNASESSPAIGPDGRLYLGCDNGGFYAFTTTSTDLADSTWPMFGADARHTGRGPAGSRIGGGLVIIAQSRYVPDVPVPVRIEVRRDDGSIFKDFHGGLGENPDDRIKLSIDQPGATVSPSELTVFSGVASGLLDITASGPITLNASLRGERFAVKTLARAEATTMTDVGSLPDTLTEWSPTDGLIHVTQDLSLPAGHTLRLQPGTIVLMAEGAGINVAGTVESLGTEDQPVVVTGFGLDTPWEEFRHNGCTTTSNFQYTFFSCGGDSQHTGHANCGPVFRVIDSAILFEYSNIIDNVGKGIASENDSTLTFDGCLIARNITGMELGDTLVDMNNTWFTEMPLRGDAGDNDALYLKGSQPRTVKNCVFALMGDEGIDTLDSEVLVEDCIIYGCQDKGISLFHGTTTIRNCLIFDCNQGIVAKGDNTTGIIENTTIAGVRDGLYSRWKSNTNENDFIEFWAKDLIIQCTEQAVRTDYDPARMHITYTNMSADTLWPGQGNINVPPLFADPAAGDYRLRSAAGRWDPFANEWVFDTGGSECIDAGDPTSDYSNETAPNGGRVNMGAYGNTPQASRSGIVSDINGDGCVNVADLLTVRNILGATGSNIQPPSADLNGDDLVNVADLLTVRNHLGDGPNCQ